MLITTIYTHILCTLTNEKQGYKLLTPCVLGNVHTKIMSAIKEKLHDQIEIGMRDLENKNIFTDLPTRKVCFFKLKDGKFLTDNGIEITTEMLVKHPHQITEHWGFIVLD